MKNLKPATITLAICALLFTGCSSVGNTSLSEESTQSIEQKITEGVTTKQTIIGFFGQPTETTFTDSGLEVIQYSYQHIKPKIQNFIPYNFFSQVSDAENKELVILLDNESIVKKVVMNEINEQIRWGILE